MHWRRAFLRARLVEGGQISAADPSSAAVEAFCKNVTGAEGLSDNAAVAKGVDVLFLATKPQHLAAAVANLAGDAAGKLVISIAAGVTLKTLDAALPKSRLVRVMPNTPCLVGESASGYSLGPRATEADGALVKQLLESVGLRVCGRRKTVGRRHRFVGLGAGVRLCDDRGPERRGRADGFAARRGAATGGTDRVRGAATMVLETGEHPGVLKDGDQPWRDDDCGIGGAGIGRISRHVDRRGGSGHAPLDRIGKTVEQADKHSQRGDSDRNLRSKV